MGLDVGQIADVIGPVAGAVIAERDPAVKPGFAERLTQRAGSLPQLVIGDRGVFGDAHRRALRVSAAPGAATSPRSIAAA